MKSIERMHNASARRKAVRRYISAGLLICFAMAGSVYAQTAQTITFTVPTTPVTYGVAPITLSATASSGLAVIFSVTSGPATVSGSTLTISGAGTVVVAANQAGNTTYAAAPTVPKTIVVNKAVLTVTATNCSKVYGGPYPNYTYAITGFVGSDTKTSATSGAASLTTTTTGSSSVGIYTLTATAGTLAATNYSFTYVSGTLTITKAGLTVTANNASKVYGTANPAFTVAAITGFVNNDTQASAVTGAPTLSTLATTASAVGNYAITPTVGTLTATNYSFTNLIPGTLAVTQAALTVTVNSASMTYGGVYPAFSGTPGTLVNGDTLGGTVIVTYSSTTPATSNVGTYTGAITAGLSGASAGNYALTVTPGTLTITKAALTVTDQSFSMTYGGTVPTFTATFSGLVNNDALGTTITLSYSCAGVSCGGASTNSVGTYQIRSGVGGTSAGNYSVTNDVGNLTIKKAVLTVTANNLSQVYGAATPTLTAAITGFVNNDTQALVVTGAPTLTTTATTASAVGSYSITAAVGTLAATNYSFTYVAGTLTVTQAPLAVTVAPASMTYGGSFPAFTDTSITGLVNGDTVSGTITITYSSTTPATSNAGIHTGAITAALSGTSAGNYALTVSAGTLTISKASLTIDDASASMVYGGTVPAFTLSSVTGLVNGDSVGTTITIGYICSATSSSPVGTYQIRAGVSGGSSAGNYTVTDNVNNLTISKAVLKVTAASFSRVYDTANPTFTDTITGFVNGDTLASATTGAPSLTTTATTASAVGSYTITAAVGTLTATNYSFIYVNGTLAVTQAGLTVTMSNAGMTYGGSFPTFTDTSITGLINGDTVGGTITVTYSSTTPANSNAGIYTGAIMATVGGTSAGNYTVTINPGTLTISKAGLIVTVNAANMTYGGGFPTFKSTLATLVNGDTLGGTITVTYSSTAPVTSNAGTYTSAITATVGGSSAGNYTVTATPATLTIAKAVLTLTAPSPNRVYGTANPTLTAAITGFVNNETQATATTGAPSLTTTATTASSVGSYPVTVTVGTLAATNYSFNFVPGTLAITQAPLTVTVTSPASMTYGGTLPTFTGAVAGLVNGDSVGGKITVTYSSTTPASSNAGTYAGAITATVGGSSAGNYEVAVIPGTLTISDAALTVTVSSPPSIPYGGSLPTFTGAVSGLLNGDSLGAKITVTYSSPATATSNAGNYPIIAVVTGTSAGNYTVTVNSGTLTITQITPTLSVSTSGTPSNFGSAVTFTATVSGAGPASPTGTVAFIDSGTAIGTGGISGTTATFATKTLIAGTQSITASYGGDTNYVAVTSSAISQVVTGIVLPAPGIIQTLAGGATTVCTNHTDTVGDGCPATSATLNQPNNVQVDSSGNVYIGDSADDRVRMVTAATSNISSFVGSGTKGFVNGTASSADLYWPWGTAFDPSGNFYVAEEGNNALRKVTFSGGIGTVTTEAGTGTGAYYGNGIPASQAELWAPQGIAVDASGDIYIADTYNNRIRMIAASTANGHTSGDIYTVAGIGPVCFQPIDTFGDGCPATSSTLNQPGGVAFDSSGNLYIADFLNNRIRMVAASTSNGYTAGNIYTVAGGASVVCSTKSDSLGDGCPATSATLDGPASVALDSSGNLYIADFSNNRVRMVAASGTSSFTAGYIYTVAGGTTDCSPPIGDGCLATSALLNGPGSVALDLAGNLYIDDWGNNRIRVVGAQVTAPGVTLSCFPSSITYGGSNPVCTVSVAGGATGTVSLTYNGTVWTTVTLASSSATATWPSTTGTGSFTIRATYNGDHYHTTSNAVTTLVVAQTATTLTLTAASASMLTGGNNTFTATISGGVNLSNTVIFQINGMTFCSVPISNGVAICTVNNVSWGIGVYTISATYSGDANNAGSTATIYETVNQAPSGSSGSSGILSPLLGIPGSSLIISGSGFGSAQGSSSVTFTATGTSIATPAILACGSCWGASAVTVQVPTTLTAGSYLVAVNVGGTVVAQGAFLIEAPDYQPLNPARPTDDGVGHYRMGIWHITGDRLLWNGEQSSSRDGSSGNLGSSYRHPIRDDNHGSGS